MTTYMQAALLGEGYKVKVKGKDCKGKERQLVGRVLHLGGGLQSSVMVEMVVEGLLEKPDIIIFADTGNEPSYVYENVEYLNNRLHTIGLFNVKVSRSERGILYDLVEGKGRFTSIPVFTDRGGRLRRQCTAEYKIKPIQDYILNWLVYKGHAKKIKTKSGLRRIVNRDIFVESWFGFTTDEVYRVGGGKFPKWQRPTYPLFEMNMSRGDCIDWLDKYSLPIPQKSACIICPYRSNWSWQKMAADRPVDFGYAEAFDEWLRMPSRITRGLRESLYLHRSCKPLGDAVKNQYQMELPDDLCAGSCWT